MNNNKTLLKKILSIIENLKYDTDNIWNDPLRIKQDKYDAINETLDECKLEIEEALNIPFEEMNEWISILDGVKYKCNICGNLFNRRTRYCPYCGDKKFFNPDWEWRR